MLLLDHKYREMKGHYMWGETDKLSSLLNVPPAQIKIDRQSIDPSEEINAAAEKLQRQKEIEMKRRKAMKQNFDKKISDLQGQIAELEWENEEKDIELKHQMAKISEIQSKLKAKRNAGRNMEQASTYGLVNQTSDHEGPPPL